MEMIASVEKDVEREGLELPESKCHCVEYALEMRNFPEAACNKPGKIVDLFSPIEIRGFGWVKGATGGFWKVNFNSQRDVETALEEKQWQYLDDHCIRLTRLDEHAAMQGQGTWASIHHDLQLDILSYSDVYERARLRRVCQEWNVLLEPLWDREVNRCLYLDVRGVKLDEDIRDKMYSVLDHAAKNAESSWDDNLHLVLKFDLADDLCTEEVFYGEEPTPFDLHLSKCQYKSLMIVGLKVMMSDFTGTSRFYPELRWPGAMKLVLHNCRFHFCQDFAAVLSGSDQFTEGEAFSDIDIPWTYTIPAKHLQFKVNQFSTGPAPVEIYREMDKQRAFWPFPPEQLEWFRSLLDGLPKDDPNDLLEMNNAEEYSLRQAIRRYLTSDEIRQKFDKWHPTGVFFEGTQLAWRDCLFLALLTAKKGLLGRDHPPHDADSIELQFMGYM